MAAAKVKVTVLEHRAITVDGRLYGAGETVAVPATEAKTLVSEGYVSKG